MNIRRTVLRHPWQMRRWLLHPKDVWMMFRREQQNRRYEKREGHPFYGPVPPDCWPQPVPGGFGFVFRCIGCGLLGYDGTHTGSGCTHCGSHAGVVVARYGRFEGDI